MYISRYWEVFFVILMSITLTVLQGTTLGVFDYDIEIFKYAGMALVKGDAPYRDFFDHKPPLIYVIHAIAYSMGAYGLLIVNSALTTLAALLFYYTCKMRKWKPACLLPILFVVLLRIPVVSMGLGLVREYTTILILIFFCVSLLRAKQQYLLSGVLVALVFWLQQEQVILMLLLLGFSIFQSYREGKRSVVRQCIQVAIGFLLPSICVAVYLYSHDLLNDFWSDTVLFNIKYYQSRPSLKDIILYFGVALKASSVFVAIAPLVLAVFFVRKNLFHAQSLSLVVIITFLLSPIAFYLSGRPILYYFQSFAATIPLALLCVVPSKAAEKKWVCVLISSSLVYILALEYRKDQELQSRGWVQNSPELKYLVQQRLADRQLYVVGESRFIYLYNNLKVLSPSKWLYHHFWYWYPTWDADLSVSKSIFKELDTYNTQYILYYFPERESTMQPSVLHIWQVYLERHYERVALTLSKPNAQLWKRKVH